MRCSPLLMCYSYSPTVSQFDALSYCSSTTAVTQKSEAGGWVRNGNGVRYTAFYHDAEGT